MSTEVDFLIIGHGLAGAILSFELMRRGKSVLVFDQNDPNSASRIAAGIINPVTGHRLNITDKFSEFYPAAKRFYRDFEQHHKTSVFQHEPQSRLIKNQGQYDFLQKRLNDPAYADVLGDYDEQPDHFLIPQFGAIEVNQSATINTELLLETSQLHLQNVDALRLQSVDYATIATEPDGFRLEGAKAKQLIFCEGYQATNNPWLAKLPFKLAKGEIIDLKLDSPLPYLSWGHWLIPRADSQHARLGSSYDWNDLSSDIVHTESLLQSLEKYVDVSANLMGARSGIRPTTKHRVPFIGQISTLPNAYCFNGFGSKGCLLIPYHAEHFCDFLLHDSPLAPELTQWL